PARLVRGDAAAGARGPAVVGAAGEGPGSRAAARRDGGFVDAVCPVLGQVVLHRGAIAAGADSHVHVGAAAVVVHEQPGHVLALAGVGIGRARAAPRVPAVVREVHARLGARDQVVAVARVHGHFADGLVLWE